MVGGLKFVTQGAGAFLISGLQAGDKPVPLSIEQDLLGSARSEQKGRGALMKDKLLKLYVKSQELVSGEEGQDLVEYALIIALISVAAIVFLPTLADSINASFTAIEAKL
jgi:pilus assembly protein Flp/PilA